MRYLKARRSLARRFGWTASLAIAVAASLAVALSSGGAGAQAATGKASAAAGSLETGLNVSVIPNSLGDSYFTAADSVKTGGALAALKTLGEKGTEIGGNAATAASQLPAVQAAIARGAGALIVSATDPTGLCTTLKQAMARGIPVVTYASDAPSCRSLFVEEASSEAIGKGQVDLLAKQIHRQGQIAIVSAAADATNQNTWIGYMKQELNKYPKMRLVHVVYGNDDPTTAAQVARDLLQRYPNLKGIISPTNVGLVAVAGVLDSKEYRGQIALTGIGTSVSMKKFVKDGTVKSFELSDPAKLGYLAAYAAVNLASKTITGAQGQSFMAGKLGKYKIGPNRTVLLGPPRVFNSH